MQPNCTALLQILIPFDSQVFDSDYRTIFSIKLQVYLLQKLKYYVRHLFLESKRFEVVKSELISTQVFDTLNKIEGEFRAATFHDQVITWGESAANSPLVPFDNLTLHASCSCKYHIKMVEEKTSHVRKYCTHIIGQLRRVIFMTN